MYPTALRARDGLTLRAQAVRPDGSPARAKVLVVHGLGDHLDALPYRSLAQALAKRGLAVYLFDLRGHGRSEGPRMYVEGWPALMDDVRLAVEAAQADEPRLPLYVLGISLGGLIALRFAQEQPGELHGLVLLAPAVSAEGAPPLVRALMPVLSRLLPRLALDPGLNLARISRDAAAVAEYVSDPLFQVKTTPRLAAEVLKTIPLALAEAPHLRLPVLLLHGEADGIVPPAASAALFEQLGSPDKVRQTYPGAYHNLLIETNRAEVFGDIVGWIEQHL